MSTPLSIVVSAMLGEVPGQGGWAWAVLQYLLGLKQLGHHVLFIDTLSHDKMAADAALSDSAAARYFCETLQQFGLLDESSLMLPATRETVGLPYEQVLENCRGADVLLNISGRLADEEIRARIPLRAYIDLDPAFTQLWHVAHGIDMRFEGHTHYVTIGNAIGRPECNIPTCGLDWITMNQPIVLQYWPRAEQIVYDGLTTIANWRGYGSAEYQGKFYGQKAHSLRQFMDLPKRCSEAFILALGIHQDERQDLTALRENGWKLLDPTIVAGSPSFYQRFIQGSKAEFGIAKSGYVLSECGWFSDRSICYLASGRPVIAQETGFSRFLPTGEGLFAFRTCEDVTNAIQALNEDYPRHALAARRIAEEHFDSNNVLDRLLRCLGAIAS